MKCFEIQKVNIKKLINSILNEIQFQLQESKVKISIGDLPNCYCDLIQINQVFTNLIDNAIKYLKSDIKGIIKIEGYIENNRCIYTIEDNGIGIELRHNNKIFEIFHRLNPIKSIKGEGLGLTIVKRIIDRHNGKIWVESKKGKGSKFYISLPNNK